MKKNKYFSDQDQRPENLLIKIILLEYIFHILLVSSLLTIKIVSKLNE